MKPRPRPSVKTLEPPVRKPARRVPRFVPSLARSRGAREPARVLEVVRRLHAEYPEAECALERTNAFELLVATILSAQCTDVRVNQVTRTLFRKYRKPEDYARAPIAQLEEDVRPTGFFRNKARNVQGMARAVVAEHGGKVPSDLESLTKLPGVGRKTANVILSAAYGVPAVVVDTHVTRLSRRLGWSRNEDPAKIEQDLMKILPREEWGFVSDSLILHGRRICKSQRPRCNGCVLGAELCPSYDPKAPA